MQECSEILTKVVLIALVLTFSLSHTLAQFFSMDYKESAHREQHSLFKPYTDLGHWDGFGAAVITPEYIRLTPDLKSQQGAIWNNKRVDMRNWGVHINFKIHGKGAVNQAGDGIAFWYVKERMIPGPVFGSKDYFSGLGVFIDTYENHLYKSRGEHSHEHPYISIIVNNGSQKYNHDDDGGSQNLGGCSVKVRNKNVTQILVRYDNNMATILADVDGKGRWDICFQVDGIELPTGYYFGISAATGDLSDNHDIFFVQTYEATNYEMRVHSIHASRDGIIPSARGGRQKEDEGGAWSVTKIMLVLMAVTLIAGCGYGLVAVTSSKPKGT